MADLIAIDLKTEPWRPAHNAELVETWHVYDAPLTGVVVQHNVPHLFHCLLGGGRDASVWAYAPLTGQDHGRLASLSGTDFAAAIEQVIVSGNVVCAVAASASGILWADDFEPMPDAPALLALVNERFAAWAQELQQAAHATSQLEAV